MTEIARTAADRQPSSVNISSLLVHPRKGARQDSRQQLDPAPDTPILTEPSLPQEHVYGVPARRIITSSDLTLFTSSPTYNLILAFIFGVSDATRQQKRRLVEREDQSATVQAILGILDDATELLRAHPPLETGSRFGNPAFRSYIEAIAVQSVEWHSRLSVSPDSVKEIAVYFQQSFGSAQRIDYGSGHELNFFLWLLCLNRLALLPPTTFRALALVVFPRYLKLVREVQSTYYLEPAGSHGVWGLDDYQFLPFLFGSAQLVHHPYVTPRSIHSAPTVEECAPDYLYLDQVAFVNSVKNVDGLRWHSPMLDDISSAKSWAKVEAGMKKMFVREVLGKLPVMQHFLFGSLIPAADGMSPASAAEEQSEDAIHTQQHEHGKSWSDCCGIKVPSHFGAAGEMRKRMGGESLRRLPFD